MKKDLMVIEKDNFFSKIKKLFLNITSFFKKEKNINKIENKEEILQNHIQKNKFEENIKSNVDVKNIEFFKNQNIDDFISKIKNNPTMMDSLSKDRLITLRDYLKTDIMNKEEQLLKLKKSV